jgi:hypothetical protein
MRPLLFLLIFCALPLFAERIDESCSTFDNSEKPLYRVDTFDFTGEYPDLKKIEIDAKKKMRVEVLLSGIYPALRSIRYDGTFGALNGKLTGVFPNLEQIALLCGSTSMNLDFTGQWEKSCTILITAATGDLNIKIPSDVGIVVDTKTGIKSKVVVKESDLKKEGYGVVNKRYMNEIAESCPVVLHFTVALREGTVTFERESLNRLDAPSKETFLEGRKRESHPLLQMH